MKTAGIWTTIVGALVLIGCVAGGIAMSISSFLPMVNMQDDFIPVSGPGNTLEQHFDAGQEMQLYTYGADGVYVGPTPNCSVDGPAPVQEGSAMRSSVTLGAQSRISFASIVFVEAGTYTITCDQEGVSIAPPLSVSGIFSGVGGVLLAVFGGIMGFLILAVGIVLWIMGARRRHRSN